MSSKLSNNTLEINTRYISQLVQLAVQIEGSSIPHSLASSELFHLLPCLLQPQGFLGHSLPYAATLVCAFLEGEFFPLASLSETSLSFFLQFSSRAAIYYILLFFTIATRSATSYSSRFSTLFLLLYSPVSSTFTKSFLKS